MDNPLAEMAHQTARRGTRAIAQDRCRGAAELPAVAADNERLRELVNDHEYYRVVAASIKALAKLDYAASENLVREQAASASNYQIKLVALEAMAKHNSTSAGDLIFAALDDNMPDDIQTAGLQALSAYKQQDSRLVPALRKVLRTDNFGMVFAALQLAGDRKLKALLPDLEELKKRIPIRASFVNETEQKINS